MPTARKPMVEARSQHRSTSEWMPTEAMLEEVIEVASGCLDVIFKVLVTGSTKPHAADAAGDLQFRKLMRRLKDYYDIEQDPVTKKTLGWLAQEHPQSLVVGKNFVCHTYHHAVIRLARHVYYEWNAFRRCTKDQSTRSLDVQVSERLRDRGVSLTKREFYELGAHLKTEATLARKSLASCRCEGELKLTEDEDKVLAIVREHGPQRLKGLLPHLESENITEQTAKSILARLVKVGILRKDGGYHVARQKV